MNTRQEQLQVNYNDGLRPPVTVPIEDVGVVMIDHAQVTYSQTLLSKLIRNNVAFITCNEKHMPQGLILNLDGNHIQSERFKIQISASLPLKKNLWQQTIKAKILNQARLLEKNGFSVDNLNYWAGKVKSGDPENLEGRAAAFYWKQIFENYIPNFLRGRYELEPNNLLNYGYAILRAIIARNLVGSGMMPTLGIHHKNKYNAYCLADDIMEPYRPFVDQVVLELVKSGLEEFELTKEVKKSLLKIPVIDVEMEGRLSPLMVASAKTTSSLFKCFEGESRKMVYPDLV